MINTPFSPLIFRENYLFICSCQKCMSQMDDADMTSEDEEEVEGEGETEGDDVEDEMTDVWFHSGFSAHTNHFTCLFVDLSHVIPKPSTGRQRNQHHTHSSSAAVLTWIKAYAKYKCSIFIMCFFCHDFYHAMSHIMQNVLCLISRSRHWFQMQGLNLISYTD